MNHHSCGPQVLSFLDSSGFRAVLRDCCPQIQALPAEELLRRYRNEARVAELAHAASRNRGIASASRAYGVACMNYGRRI